MMRTLAMLLGLAVAGIAVSPGISQAPVAKPATNTPSPALVALFTEWRAFNHPAIRDGLPDYGAAAMARKADALPQWRARLAAIDPSIAPADRKLIGAEINGLDFFLRVLKPWARDPGFYQTVFADQSDVPAHEGPSAEPNIDLWAYKWPLSRADDATLTTQLGAVPALLDQAKINLADSKAHDLWAYGDRAFREQAATLKALEAGTLRMRDLTGYRTVDMSGASPALREAIGRARAATEGFAAYVAAEAPKRQGPSGVGRENYDRYAKNVLLSPYDWSDQVLLLQRELDRSLASLRLEEVRNRDVPPIREITNPAAYRAMAEAKTKKFNDFLVSAGFVPDRRYFRAALEAQTSSYTPPAERNFFSYGTSLDPLPLLSHSTHWIELARLKNEPHADLIRRSAPLFNIFADRSEGLATAMEELVMHTGLYDDIPHGRELVWIMLANRAARGLASLRVQANEMDLDEAGRFHAAWTPRGWSDPASPLVGFEQLLYLRQPGYGPSYVIGKLQFDGMIARASHAADTAKQPFDWRATWAKIIAAGILPPSLIAEEIGLPETPR